MTSSIPSKISLEHLFRAAAVVSLIVVTIAPAAGAAPPEPAPAENRTHAKRLFEQGQAHYDLGEYDEAILAFREAYEISSAPALLFNIAQSHRLKGDCSRALQVYRHFVRLDPNSPHRLSAESHVATLVAQCETKVQAAPATSSSSGPGETPNLPRTSEANDAGATQEAAFAAPVPPPKPARGGGTPRHVVLGLVSGGLALAGVAAALHVWNDARFDTWQTEDRTIYAAPPGANPGEVRARQAANNELLGDIRRTDAISLALAIAGGASLVAGGTLFFTWQPSTVSNDSTAVRLSWTTSW